MALVERELRAMLDNERHLHIDYNIRVTAERIVGNWEADYLAGINTTLREVNANIRRNMARTTLTQEVG